LRFSTVLLGRRIRVGLSRALRAAGLDDGRLPGEQGPTTNRQRPEQQMATVRLWTDAEAEANAAVKAVFDDIRATRKSDFINNFWRGLANNPALLKRTWEGLKAVMAGEGALDPLVREMIYIAVSTANGCTYCVHSHTAAAKARGMTEAQHAELLAVIGLAGQTNHLVTAMQIPVDPEFQV
jgi:AhpD family alkylhydroperoxidase